jgi:hypothetical protein
MEVLSSRPRSSGWAFITGATSFSRPRATNVLVDGGVGEEAEADHVTGRAIMMVLSRGRRSRGP